MYTVKDILKKKGSEVVSIDPESTVYEALKKMAGHNIGALVVTKERKLMGIFSERDYARKIILMGKTSRDSKVGELMTDRMFAVKTTTTVNDCMRLMTEQRVRHLPVLENDELLGIVSIGDVVNKTIEDQKKTISQLEDYIVGKR
ncbi:MAG: CBS domain-containing protein [Bacteroidales bacterium]|nr:CBS domain-containing protein [Bacteroidales bacterium]MBN2820765.1 CBS domain-containing protein [Bacteroidales bacterium]